MLAEKLLNEIRRSIQRRSEPRLAKRECDSRRRSRHYHFNRRAALLVLLPCICQNFAKGCFFYANGISLQQLSPKKAPDCVLSIIQTRGMRYYPTHAGFFLHSFHYPAFQRRRASFKAKKDKHQKMILIIRILDRCLLSSRLDTAMRIRCHIDGIRIQLSHYLLRNKDKTPLVALPVFAIEAMSMDLYALSSTTVYSRSDAIKRPRIEVIQKVPI